METLFHQMDDWYQTIPGQLVYQAEKRAVKRWLAQWPGEILLQLGGPNKALYYDDCRFDTRIRLSPEQKPSYHGPSIQSSFQQLPFLPNTMDVVLMPHVLEHGDMPEEILREVYRVLVAGGHVLILSFNAYSTWGMSKFFRDTQTFPWRGKYWGALRLRKWLNHTGFKVESQKNLFFRPPWQSHRGQKCLRFLEPMGQLIYPYFGAVNILVAKKAGISVTPVKGQLSNNRVRVGSSYLEPTTRNY